jgi:hypothetical protein
MKSPVRVPVDTQAVLFGEAGVPTEGWSQMAMSFKQDSSLRGHTAKRMKEGTWHR